MEISKEEWIKDYLEELEDHIDDWNMDTSISIPLHKFLDMTWEEYSSYLVKPSKYAEMKYNEEIGRYK